MQNLFLIRQPDLISMLFEEEDSDDVGISNEISSG